MRVNRGTRGSGVSARGQPRRVSTVGTGRMVRVRRWPRAGRCAARPSRRGGLWVIERKLTTWRVADFRGVFVQKLVGCPAGALSNTTRARRHVVGPRPRRGRATVRGAPRGASARLGGRVRIGPARRRFGATPPRAVVPVTRSCFVDIRPARPEPPQLCRPRARGPAVPGRRRAAAGDRPPVPEAPGHDGNGGRRGRPPARDLASPGRDAPEAVQGCRPRPRGRRRAEESAIGSATGR